MQFEGGKRIINAKKIVRIYNKKIKIIFFTEYSGSNILKNTH